MAKGTGFVNVGALFNPTDSLSRSLAQLSNTFAAKGERDDRRRQLEADKAENARRFELGQSEIAEKKAANEAINKWMSDISQGSAKFNIKDYSREQQELLNKAKAGIEKDRDSTKAYLISGSDEALDAAIKPLRAVLDVEKYGKAAVDNRINQRKLNLMALRDELGDITNTTERQKRLDSALGELYQPTLDAIDNEISSGRSLVKKQKLASIMRSMPEEAKKYVSYGDIYNTVGSTLTGQTEKGLLDTNVRETERFNNALSKQYSESVNNIEKYNTKNKTGSSSSLGKVIDLLKSENSIGSFDDEDVKDGIKAMLLNGVDGESIALAIGMGKDVGYLGTSFPSVDSDEFTKLHSFAKTLSNSKNTKGKFPKKLPALPSFRQAKTLDSLQRDLLNKNLGNVPLGVLNVSRKYVDDKRAELKPPTAAATLTSGTTPDVSTVLTRSVPAPSDTPANSYAELLLRLGAKEAEEAPSIVPPLDRLGAREVVPSTKTPLYMYRR